MTETGGLKVTLDKLQNPEDWSKWKWQVNLLLRAHGLEGIVDGTRTAPRVVFDPGPDREREDKELSAWHRDDAKAASLIATGLSNQIADLVLTCGNSSEIWQKLCTRFERSSVQRLNMLIETFFLSKRVDSEDISQHVAKLQRIFTDLNTELTKNNENTLSERMLTGRILSTLGKEYDNFKDLWDTIPAKDQKLNLLIEKLCAIELMRESRASHVTGASAFVAHRVEAKDSQEKTKRKKDKRYSKDDLKKKFPCWKCHELGHWAAEFKNKEKKTEQAAKPKETSAFMVHTLEAFGALLDPEKWYCDSGASSHVSLNRSFFETFREFEKPRIISLDRKNVTMTAVGQGDIRVQSKQREIVLRDVLFVPKASANLLSVNVVAASNHNTAKESVVIRERQSGKVVATGRPCSDLFAMDFEVIRPDQVRLSTETGPSLQVHHERLVHQNKNHVRKMLERWNTPISAEEFDFCDGCALGKTHRLPYRSRRDRANAVGELINTDVNGAMQTVSLGGAKFFVMFKDDYSRYRRLFFVSRKTAVNLGRCMEEFLNEARTHGHVVKQLRSDSGTEYINRTVEELLTDRGTQHLKTPAYSPELNGAAEREMRTLVEAARSMLKSSGLPTSFWSEACNTACYVLNRTGK